MPAPKAAPKAHQSADRLLSRIAADAPPLTGWEKQTRGRPECETLLSYAGANFDAKRRHDVSPGDVLIFRVADGEAARTAGVMGDDNFFTYEIPGRDGLQTSYLGHYWRTRLVGAFAVPDGYLNPSRDVVHLPEHFQAKWAPVRVREMRPNNNSEHFQAKWEPVRVKEMRPTNNSEHFQAKWEPVRVKEMRPNNNSEPVRDFVKTGTALAAE